MCEAAIRGRTDLLAKIISEDELILDKVAVGRFRSSSPLHISAACGHTEFVKAMLEHKRKLAQVLDLADQTALHLASAEGHVEVVKVLVEAAPETCLARDQCGMNPVHVAAMYGKKDVLDNMVQTRPLAARARLDQDQTILHLCVKHNQLETLKKLHEMIDDKDFINAKDNAGNTILHLAVTSKQSEVCSFQFLF